MVDPQASELSKPESIDKKTLSVFFSIRIINLFHRVKLLIKRSSDPKPVNTPQQRNADLERSNSTELNAVAPVSHSVINACVIQLNRFTLNGYSKQFREQMLEDRYILGEMALLGQSTVIYAQPNTGKTLLVLHLLTESIKSGEIESKNVFYINADDSHSGLTEKLELAEEYGFNMLSPGHPREQPFKANMLEFIINDLVRSGEARNKILILDTMKKFTDTMSKKAASAFGEIIRAFVLNGGSAIMLAHVNKHRSDDGKLIYAGTTDAVDDSDCAYTIDTVSEENGIKIVSFQNFKKRGSVVESANYQYTNADSYRDILNSVIEVDEEQKSRLLEQKSIDDLLTENNHAISVISTNLDSAPLLKTNLVRSAQQALGISRKKVIKILEQHTGESYDDGHRWRIEKGLNNAHYYFLLPPTTNEIGALKN